MASNKVESRSPTSPTPRLSRPLRAGVLCFFDRSRDEGEQRKHTRREEEQHMHAAKLDVDHVLRTTACGYPVTCCPKLLDK